MQTEESIRLWEAISSIRNSVTNLSAVVQNSLSNVSTNVTADSLSDTKYPSVKAVKTFFNSYARSASGQLAEEINRATAAEALKENSANKSTDGTFTSNSDIKFPTERAVKTYIDSSTGVSSTGIIAEVNRATAAEGALITNLASEAATRAAADTTLTTNLTSEISRAIAVEALKESLANKSISVDDDASSDTKYPSVKAVKTYVDTVNKEIDLIAAEALIRAGADTNVQTILNTSIDAEATTRALADTTLTTNLATETSRAIAAEALKENTANKSTSIALGTSDILFPTQNAVKTYVDTVYSSIPDASTTVKGIIQLAGDLSGTADSPGVPGLVLKENTANKSTSIALGTSDILFPTQNAVKIYVDAETTRAIAAEALKENTANKSTSIALGTSDIFFPTQNAVKTYVDAISTALTTETTRAIAAESFKENTANKSTSIALGTSDILFPTQNAVKTYVDAAVTSEATIRATADTTLTTNLTNEVSRATAAEALKENTANKSTSIALGTSDVLFPSQNAVKTYVDVVSNASTTALASEATTRATADTTLTTNLANEVSRAIAAEALKENTENKSTATTLGTSDILFPTQNAVKVYVDAAIAAIPSDYRIKDDVQTLDDTYTIDNIRPVTYLNTMKNKQDIGVIAHELQAIYPFLVNGEKDGENLQTVNYNGLFGIVINEIQRLKQEVKEMRACLSL